ncbi:MAG: hypothetical protein QOE45_630 [Frankiaceae bacterium]|nr:hypothetical protein [Frankiaceae bacterium]
MSRLRRYVNGENPRPMLAMFALNAVDELDNATFIWVAPTIAAAFGKKVGDFGLITVFVLVVAPLLAVPVSLLADRRHRMPIALGAAATWGVFSLATGLAPGLWVLIAARVGASLGRTVSYPVQLSLLADFYPPQVRARALGVHALANNVGAMFGAAAGAGLAAVFGWRAPFFLLTVPTLVAIIWSARVREPERGVYEAPQSETPRQVREVFPTLYAVRSLRYLWFTQIWFAGAILGATIVLPFYFKEDFGLGTAWVGGVGLVAGAGAIVATLVGSRLAQDRLNVSPATGLRWLAGVAFAIVGLLVAFALSPNAFVAVPILFVITALFGLVAPLLATVGTMISPPELRSSAYALGQVIALTGAVFAIVVTQVAQATGNRWGFLVAAAICLRGAFHIRTATRYVDADVERLDPSHVEVGARTDDEGRVLLLETKDLTVSYDGVQVLFGVDLAIRQGEIVALLGTNGAGKSTTLNAISGLVEPDGGNVWFDGAAVTGEPPERTAARGIVQAPGGRGIFPGLTVAENLRLGAFLLRRDKALLNARLGEVLDVFPALAPLLPQRAGSLSGGQRQMLTLAQAFLLKPKLLLIDELSLGLAPVVVQELLATVRRLNADGITVVLVEQSVNVALTLADRAYFMEKGQVRFEGPTADLLARDDLLRSVFLGGNAA